MFLKLNHQKLAVYAAIREFVNESYKLTRMLPDYEKFNLCTQIRRASLSALLNLAEGSSRKSLVERNRFFEIARGSVIEVDTAIEIVIDLGYCSAFNFERLEATILSSFKLLTLLIKKS